MNISNSVFSGAVIAALSLVSLPGFADPHRACKLEGSYGYLYNGNSYSAAGTVPLTETGELVIDENGNLSGEGTLAFQFSNFGGQGPLWLLMREVQTNGTVIPDGNNPCTGKFEFVATATVLKTSNPALVPVGTVLFTNSPRSIAYTVSGLKHEIIDLVSTSPGTIASGTAHKQDKRR